MEARRDTVLDARLRTATRPQLAPDSLASRTLGEAGTPGRTTVKLLVSSQALERAAAWIADAGGRITSFPTGGARTGDTVVVADLRLDTVAALDGQPWVRRAEAPKELHPRLDQARGPITGLDAALALPRHDGLTGAGVLVAVVDTGLDWRHPDFRNADGSTRLERFVHAHVPAGTQTSRFDAFDAVAIDKALDGGPPIPAGDPGGHGTHCASIAAGNGLALPDRRFRGVAPEAALMGVRSEPLLDVHIIEGIRQAFALAGDRPAVVSLSLGGHFGAHDGTSAIENEIARASGPGRIVVVAAGNEGVDGVHAQGQLVEGEDLVLPFRVPDTGLLFCDVWIPRGDALDVWLEAPDGQRFAPDRDEVATPRGTFLVDFVENPLNRDQNLTVLMIDGRVEDRWAVRIRPLAVVHGEVHAWASTVAGAGLMFPGAPLTRYTVGMPGTEERAVTVGSLVSRTAFAGPGGQVELAALQLGTNSDFSSQGPTRVGAFKPDVVAPGQVLTAALSAGSEFTTDPRLAGRLHPSGRYVTIQGTSMATPFVAGIVALMLQREPTLTPEDVQQRLRTTAGRDAATGPVWNPRYGWGKLDAAALLDTVAPPVP